MTLNPATSDMVEGAFTDVFNLEPVMTQNIRITVIADYAVASNSGNSSDWVFGLNQVVFYDDSKYYLVTGSSCNYNHLILSL